MRLTNNLCERKTRGWDMQHKKTFFLGAIYIFFLLQKTLCETNVCCVSQTFPKKVK